MLKKTPGIQGFGCKIMHWHYIYVEGVCVSYAVSLCNWIGGGPLFVTRVTQILECFLYKRAQLSIGGKTIVLLAMVM